MFDFAVVEQCQRYRECARFTRAYGDQVLEIEYRRKDFDAACDARGARLPILYRDVNLRHGVARISVRHLLNARPPLTAPETSPTCGH